MTIARPRSLTFRRPFILIQLSDRKRVRGSKDDNNSNPEDSDDEFGHARKSKKCRTTKVEDEKVNSQKLMIMSTSKCVCAMS